MRIRNGIKHERVCFQILGLSLIVLVTNSTHGAVTHGINFIGIGYNLLKGNPDGGVGNQGGVDPGLNTLRHIFQLSPGDVPHEVVYEKRQSCLDVKTIDIFYGAKSYQHKLGINIDASGKGNPAIADFSFSLSPRFEKESSETNQNRRVLQDDQNICNLGSARYAEELADNDGFSVTRNFASAVCKLPVHYDAKRYMQFLDDWGTHVTVQVNFGTKNITRYQASLAEFFQHVQKNGGFGFSFGGSYMGFGASLGINFQQFKQSDKYKLKIGQRQTTLHSGTIALPEPIGLKIKTIVTALDPVYWTSPDVRSACPAMKTEITSKSNNLLKALEGYASFKLAPVVTDPELKIPITWPAGTYGLVKTTSGCPAGRVTWHQGSRHQDTNNIFNKNSWSNPIHIAGLFTRNKDMTWEFCMKGDTRISEFDADWPAGDYCILKYGNCPGGFSSGYIYWDDSNFHNKDHSSGSLPNGQYGRDTRVDFCCRDDSLPTHHIFLPTEKPFVLFKYTRECQGVHGMSVREEYFGWDDKNWFNHDKAGGAHPYDDGGRRDHKLHFCYYYKAGTKLIG
ncbi:hypothetical protein SNE40_017361 [Patella caerulea]|uniref:MACPF domain-containing protein n=1 Tax=Patella caerulea TaxID=87958 RepID=A0AAN8JEW6_PATCE